jgi:serine/threonine protein kinase
VLGGGEFGEVYKAKWHGSYVAAKVLKRSDEIALGDFRTEIAILRKIHHPNCVQVGLCRMSWSLHAQLARSWHCDARGPPFSAREYSGAMRRWH